MCDNAKNAVNEKLRRDRDAGEGCDTVAVRAPTSLESLRNEQQHLIQQLTSVSDQINYLEQREHFANQLEEFKKLGSHRFPY